MKQIFCLIAALTLLICTCSCAGIKPKLSFVEAQQAGLLDSQDTVLEALGLYKNANPFCKRPDPVKDAEFNNYRKETKTDNDSSTSIDYYYDGDKLVFVEYKGFGEDTFEVYTDEGHRLFCTDDDGKRIDASLTAKIGEYDVTVSPANGLDEDSYYSAKALNVVVATDDTGGFKTYSNYYVDTESGKIYIQDARYREKGKSWFTYYYDPESEAYSDILYEMLSADVQPNIAGDPAAIKAVGDADAIAVQLMFGSGHKFCFTEAEGITRWYINAPLLVFFDNEDKCDAFLRNHPQGDKESYIDENDKAIFYWKATALLPFAEGVLVDGQENLTELIETEFNDYIYYNASIDKDGNITALERKSIIVW